MGDMLIGLIRRSRGRDNKTLAAFAEAIESTTHYEMDGPMLLLLSNGDLKAVFQAKPAKSE